MITEVVFASLKNWGGHPVFIELTPSSTAVSISAEEFRHRIEATSYQLKCFGIREKHLVPLFLENSVDFATIFLALLDLNAVPILVKLDYRQLELDEIFNNAKPQVVITERAHLSFLQPYLNDRIVIQRHNGRLNLIQEPPSKLASAQVEDDIASINYTYRGYGYPLGAMVSHQQYLHGARVLQEGLQACAGEKMLVILPMSHIFTLVGCLLVPLFYGMTSIIARTLHPRYIFQYIHDYRIDHITSVPEIYEMLYRFRDQGNNLSSLKTFVSGGSLLTADRYEKIKRAFGIDLLHGYGLTEFAPASRNIRGQARAGTIGPICRGIECRIDSPTANGAGEILIKTPSMVSGYYRRPKETKDAFIDGWFRTGDIGLLKKDHLVFLREKKNTRKINGNLVDLEEVRRAVSLYGHFEQISLQHKNNMLNLQVTMSSTERLESITKSLKCFLAAKISRYKIPYRITNLS